MLLLIALLLTPLYYYNKIRITQYLKDILHNELQEKNKNAIIIQDKYKDYLYKKQQYQELCEVIHDIANQFIIYNR